MDETEIMNGDDMAPGAAQWRYEVGAVQEIKMVTPQFNRQGGALPGMMWRCPDFCRSEARRGTVAGLAALQQGEVVSELELFEGADDRRDVPADATNPVVCEACIDSDMCHVASIAVSFDAR